MCLFFIITVIICFFWAPPSLRSGRAFRWAGRHALRGAPDPPDLLSGVGLRLRSSASLRTGFASLATPPIPGTTGSGDFRQNALFSFLDSAVAPFQTDENLRPPTNSGLNRSEIRRPFKGRTRHPRTLFIIPRKKSTTFEACCMHTCIQRWTRMK